MRAASPQLDSAPRRKFGKPFRQRARQSSSIARRHSYAPDVFAGFAFNDYYGSRNRHRCQLGEQYQRLGAFIKRALFLLWQVSPPRCGYLEGTLKSSLSQGEGVKNFSPFVAERAQLSAVGQRAFATWRSGSDCT